MVEQFAEAGTRQVSGVQGGTSHTVSVHECTQVGKPTSHWRTEAGTSEGSSLSDLDLEAISSQAVGEASRADKTIHKERASG